MINAFLAALLFVLPKTPVDPALKGWEKEGVVPLPYAAACQRLSADLATDGWVLVRTERLGEGARTMELRKFANARGATVIFRLWRLGTSVTGYSYRRDRSPRGSAVENEKRRQVHGWSDGPCTHEREVWRMEVVRRRPDGGHCPRAAPRRPLSVTG